MKDLVSIIVPVYKVEKYLETCVKSILSQSYTEFELVLVDDGSPDNCGSMCDQLALDDTRIKVIHKPNGGQSSARNMALNVVRGNWIMFVDSDDEIEPIMIENMLGFALSNHCDIVRCNCKTRGMKGDQIRHLPVKPGIYEIDQARELIMKDILGSQPCFGLYRSLLWNGVRFPEGRIYEDIAALFLVYMNCKTPVGIIDEPFYIYNLHDDSTSFSISPNKNYDRFLAFKERWKYAVLHNLPYTDFCFSKAFTTALGTYNYYLRYTEKRLSKEKLEEVFYFLATNKKAVLKNKECGMYYHLLFRLYYLNRSLYSLVLKILMKMS